MDSPIKQTKQPIATFLRQMLMLRREGAGVPLNTNEERLLDNENQKLSKDFIARLAADYDLTTGRIYTKEIARQRDYTWEVIDRWAARLWEILGREGFLNPGFGIKQECKSPRASHASPSRSRPPFGLNRIVNADETPGFGVLRFRAFAMFDAEDSPTATRIGNKKNIILSVMLACTMAGNMLKPYLLVPAPKKQEGQGAQQFSYRIGPPDGRGEERRWFDVTLRSTLRPG